MNVYYIFNQLQEKHFSFKKYMHLFEINVENRNQIVYNYTLF